MKLWRSRRAPHVVFIHAGGVDGRMWHPLAERLEGRRLHIPDLRGHGSTPLPPGEYSHAEDLLRMLDDLRIRRATLVGASFGGWVALQLATKAPERVNGAGTAGLDQPRSRRVRMVAGDRRLPSRRRRRCSRPATSTARWRSACASGSRAPACATSWRR